MRKRPGRPGRFSFPRHSGMRLLAQARNPYSRSWLWIPGSRFARPGMTTLSLRERRIRFGCNPRQQAFLDRLDLQRQMLRADPALRQAAGDEPQAGLAGAGVHVAQFLLVAKTPDRADAVGDWLAKQLSHQRFLALVAGRKDDQISSDDLAALHLGAFGDEGF